MMDATVSTEFKPTPTAIWSPLPRQPKQARCRQNLAHLKLKRTFFWMIEATGYICQDCVNVRETRRALEEGRLAGNAGKYGNVSGSGKLGKVSRSTKAPVVIGAVMANRANGANKAEIARRLKISHNTVDKILDETEFDAQIALGRSQAVGLIPKALKGAEMAFEKGDGATSCRFLEGMGVLGEQNVSLSFAKSLRRHHKDFFPRDVSISVLDGRPMMFSPGERCSQKM